jgi:selenide,water dikinase
LSKLPKVSHPNLIIGSETGDDAAVYKLDEDVGLVFTVDFFPPITDDAYEFGAISAANSLSDVYAMGGKPLMALNITGFPDSLDKDILGDILRGGYDKAAEAGCLLVGGHTVDDLEPKYGMAVVGLVPPGKAVSNKDAKPGDVLILTKPIGTGIITTAGKQNKVSSEVMELAISIMSTLNKTSSEIMMDVGVHACTDVTGFGLMGHLMSMMKASNTTANIVFADVPVIEGTWNLLDQGIVPGGTMRNKSSVDSSINWFDGITEQAQLLLCDAQTSGGLLISVSQDKSDLLLDKLHKSGILDATVIGKVDDQEEALINIK